METMGIFIAAYKAPWRRNET